MRKPTGWPLLDSLIIIYDAVKGIFSKKKELSKEG